MMACSFTRHHFSKNDGFSCFMISSYNVCILTSLENRCSLQPTLSYGYFFLFAPLHSIYSHNPPADIVFARLLAHSAAELVFGVESIPQALEGLSQGVGLSGFRVFFREFVPGFLSSILFSSFNGKVLSTAHRDVINKDLNDILFFIT